MFNKLICVLLKIKKEKKLKWNELEMKWEMKQSKWNKKKKKIIQRLLVWVVGLTGGWI